MLHLARIMDKANGCVFVPPQDAKQPEGVVDTSSAPGSQRPNAPGLFTSAMAPVKGPRSDVRDVQERWIDARDEWDAYENAQWRREGQRVQEEAVKQKSKTRERVGSPKS